MTVYYTQEQIDDIGAFMADKITENGEALKVFLQEKIDQLEPAEPAPSDPDAGGETTTASGGMFLDDGREIKVRELFIDVIANSTDTGILIDIPANSVISVTAMAVKMSADEGQVGYYYLDQTQTGGWKFNYSLSSSAGGETSVFRTYHASTAYYTKIRALITYLA